MPVIVSSKPIFATKSRLAPSNMNTIKVGHDKKGYLVVQYLDGTEQKIKTKKYICTDSLTTHIVGWVQYGVLPPH